MAISDEEIIEIYSKLNKCLITWKILDIKPNPLNDCETLLDIIVKWKEWYYNIKTSTMIKPSSYDCPMEPMYYTWKNYKGDIWKEKSFLVNKDWFEYVDLEKSRSLDLTKTPPPLIKIDGLWLVTTWEDWIKEFPNIEICKPNLENTKELNKLYLNFVLQDYKKEIFNSNNTIYYIWIFIIFFGIILALILTKFMKHRKQD